MQITIISIHPPDDVPEFAKQRYFHIQLKPEQAKILNLRKKTFLDEANTKETSSISILRVMRHYMITANDITQHVINHPTIESIKATENFDLIVFGWSMNDFQYGLAGHFQCPFVVVTTTVACKPLRQLVGNPTGLTYQPSLFINTITNMSFLQRLQNLFVSMIEWFFTFYLDHILTPVYYEMNFPSKQYPPYSEVVKNASLVLAAQHFTQNGPVLSFPGLIEISGIHIKDKPDPLPEVRKKFNLKFQVFSHENLI